MHVRAAGPSGSTSADSVTPGLEALASDLVRFAESKPASLEQLAIKLQGVQQGPLGQPMLELLQKLAPVVGSAKTTEDQVKVFEKAAACLQSMRKDIAGGRDFELARTMLGTQNERTGALLASGVDSPFKLELAWAMFELSAQAARLQLAEEAAAKKKSA